NGVAAENIVLYHYENGQWVALPTTVSGTQNGIVTFTATSPGFSLFAIAGQPGTQITTTPTVQTFADLPGESVPAPATAVNVPVVTRTTAGPAPAGIPEPVFPLPVIAVAGLAILTGGCFVVRNWWIHRQNPALFDEYD
ncbi:MAG: PGF-pre-PGF domain-containing protein, partial [Methanoregula sp.]|nr:PGF-pre-PGF domain-containing protein [Methanoregula sp.]